MGIDNNRLRLLGKALAVVLAILFCVRTTAPASAQSLNVFGCAVPGPGTGGADFNLSIGPGCTGQAGASGAQTTGAQGSNGSTGPWAWSEPEGGGTGETGFGFNFTTGANFAVQGDNSYGILVDTTGGTGGTGGPAPAFRHGGTGGTGGDGGLISITFQSGGQLNVQGDNTFGIEAISTGGLGGTGGDGSNGLGGGDGGTGGNGGTITIVNQGVVTTNGLSAIGIFAKSEGGSAGAGGGDDDIFFGHGGSGGAGGNSGQDVSATNAGSIQTQGDHSAAVLLQSMGGNGGGGGGAQSAFYTVGGTGGTGGNGEDVTFANTGTIVTFGDHAHGVSAHSIGGGGGAGGDVTDVSLFVGVSIGGSGGGGGDSGAVTATNSRSISTAGISSKGIVAASIGGGGGDGGNATGVTVGFALAFTTSLGGSGGIGGDADTVSVTNAVRGIIVTGAPADPTTPIDPGNTPIPGDHATGILAQSIGGGGGSGGSTIPVAVAGGIQGSIGAALGIGGSGGGGGDGSTVTVVNAGSIQTHARMADGIVAQSIGGGGGSGGNSTDVSASISQLSGGATVALGGSGGHGGEGGTVSVTNNGSIATLSSQSRGIVAQSIGGGGGNGGNVVDVGTAIGQNAVSVEVGVGGTGGDGGGSGNVTVETGAGSAITTSGHQAHGIVAQAVGGGGGNGGNVQSYGISLNAGKGIAANANVSVGGSGGTASTGGEAMVDLAGSIVTSGDDAKGVIVQSIGGGGGNGGNTFELSVAATLEASSNSTAPQSGWAMSAAVGVGGSGGGGGMGGQAGLQLQNGASIATSGVRSTAVVVQSIGGGGGNGGSSHSLAVSTSVPTSSARFLDLLDQFKAKIQQLFGDGPADPSTPAYQARTGLEASVSVGGTGGAAGKGGQVNVTIDAVTIATTGAQSHGVHAQSIGGGGGTGGHAQSDGYAGIDQFGIALSIGGSGGGGGKGGEVWLGADNGSGAATITTAGDSSHGVFMQSIGGGGGEGGSASSNNFSIPGLSKKTIQIGIGGSGGSNGDGGWVIYNLDANIATAGAASSAIFAQSVGGGGGTAHVSDSGDGGKSSDDGLIAVSIGGKGGSGGNGGNITVGGTSSLATSGTASSAIFAQSVGGGGGNAGIAGGSFTRFDLNQALSLHLGLDGGGGGNGGDIAIQRGGLITTTGDVAAGIFAQSLGGGGGTVHMADLTIAMQNITLNVEHTSSNGNGGDVTVSDNGPDLLAIRTTGNGSHGIVAQSMGAGGGTVILDQSSADINLQYVEGTPSGNGNSGNVSVTLGGTISTAGEGAYGILAQSLSAQVVVMTTDTVVYAGTAAYSGQANVELDAGSIVSTTGKGANGVVVKGKTPEGPMVSAGGTVQVSGEDAWGIYLTTPDTASVLVPVGGSVIANGQAAGAIYIDDGAWETQLDIKGSVTAPNAVAVRTNSQGEINVHQGGVVNGDIVGNGQANLLLRNNGSITGSVSGVENYNFDQYGMHYLALDPTGQHSDSINVSQLQAKAGNILPVLTALPTSSFQPSTIVLTSYGASTPTIDSTPQNLARFGLGTGTVSTAYTYALTESTATVTGVSVDYTRAGLSGNGGQLAQLANAQLGEWSANAQPGSSEAALVSILLSAANATTQQQLTQALAPLDATGHSASTQSSAGAAGAAQSNMQSCGDSKAGFSLIAQGDCDWGKITYAVTELRGGQQRDVAAGLSIGKQVQVAPGIFLGGSVGIEDTRFYSAFGSSEGNRLSLGAITKYVAGPFYGSAAVVGSYGWADATRHAGVAGFTAIGTAEQATSNLGFRGRAGYVFGHNQLQLMPLVDLDVNAIHDEGYTETGLGVLSMHVDAATNVLVDVRPALRLGGSQRVGDVIITSYVEGGIKFALNDGELHASLYNGPSPDQEMVLDFNRDPVVGTVAASTTLDWGTFEARFLYEGGFGEDTTSHAGSLKLGYKF